MRILRSFWKNNGVGLLFLSPWLIGLLGLSLIPIAVSLYFSFTSYDLLRPPEWIGFDNYRIMWSDERYFQSLKVTAVYVFLGVPLQLAVALSLALLLNRGLRGLNVYRAVYYIPSLFGGSVAVALLWRQIFGGKGLINQALLLFGIEGKNWISNPDFSIYTLVILLAWQFGSPMVIFLAGLKQIPADYYEAASIDGATAWSRFCRITFPLLTPVVFFNAVMQVINAFQAFTSSFIVSGGSGGPLDSTLFYSLYLYQQGFASFRMGYASAMAWVLLIIIAFFTALIFVSSKKWVHYEE